MSKGLRNLLTGAAIAFLAGTIPCAAQMSVPATKPMSVAGTDVQSHAPDPILEQRYPRYVIQRQDVLLLTFPLSPELNQTVTVQPDGYINLQSVSSLHVQGMTVPQLVEALKTTYASILQAPIINVDIGDYQKPFFTVSGQVGKPGQYELRSDITIAEALAVAGGMTMVTARTQVFLFHRTSENWLEVKKVNMKDILRGKNANEDPFVQPGDMIYVPEKFIANFRKYIPYSVTGGSYVNGGTL